MGKGLSVLGALLLIVGLILAIIFYPFVGYASAEETGDKLGSFDMGSIMGKEVKCKGTIEEVWTDSIPFIGDIFDLVGLRVISIEGLDVSGLISGSTPVIIFCDNIDVSEGDEVTVEGYGFGMSEATIIIGDSGYEAALKMSMGSPPAPAKVEKVPHSSFFIAIGVLIMGLILVIAGAVKREKVPKGSNTYQPQQKPIAQQQMYQPPPQQYGYPPTQQPPGYQPPPQQPAYQPPPPQTSYQQPTYQQPQYYPVAPLPLQSQQNPDAPRFCINCGQTLTIDPRSQKLYCQNCNSYF